MVSRIGLIKEDKGVLSVAAPEHMTNISRFIEEQMRLGQTPGLSVAIQVAGEIVLCRGYGFADVETRTPMTDRSGVVIGSTTKALTSVAVRAIASKMSH